MVQSSSSRKNKIREFLTKAAKNAGLPGNVTNHSERKTCISRLMDAGIPVNYVAQLSGHKNLKGLDSYKTASDDHQRKMSLLLGSETKSPISLIAGSHISKIEGCMFNFSFNTAPCSSGESSARSEPRKRRIIISDDSDSD